MRSSKPLSSKKVILDSNRKLSISDCADISYGNALVSIAPKIRERALATSGIIDDLIDNGTPIYGLTTGFGPLANGQSFEGRSAEIQTNLIYHLASGVGKPLSWIQSRSLVFCRLVSLSKGHSGVPVTLLDALASVLNAGLAPYIPSQGTVGASGDLTPSAHMALSLFGEGDWIDRDGERIPSSAVSDIVPEVEKTGRICLALVNGVSAMTGIASLAAHQLRHLMNIAVHTTLAVAECVGARQEAFDANLAAVRPHPGQRNITEAFGKIIDSSSWFLPPVSEETDKSRLVRFQDPYSIRCLPQALGAIEDFIQPAMQVIETEINAVSDNPVLDKGFSHVVHGGNFYGQHVAFAADTLSMCSAKLAAILDRQLDLLCDPARNGGLPKFLCRNTVGVHSGLMGAQVTMTALAAEIRSRLGHISVLGTPTNGNNQDINTMGTVAARQLQDTLDDLAHMISIHLIAIAEAHDLRQNSEPQLPCSPSLSSCVQKVREHVAPLISDRPLSDEICALANSLMDTHIESDLAASSHVK